MRRLIAGTAALALLAGCGAATATTSGPAHTVVVTSGLDGHTITVAAGDTVRVNLDESFPVPGSSLVWDVSSSNTAVLEPGAVSRSPRVRSGPGGSDTMTADFKAVAKGGATLTAHGSTTCEAMEKSACPDRSMRFEIQVV